MGGGAVPDSFLYLVGAGCAGCCGCVGKEGCLPYILSPLSSAHHTNKRHHQIMGGFSSFSRKFNRPKTLAVSSFQKKMPKSSSEPMNLQTDDITPSPGRMGRSVLSIAWWASWAWNPLPLNLLAFPDLANFLHSLPFLGFACFPDLAFTVLACLCLKTVILLSYTLVFFWLVVSLPFSSPTQIVWFFWSFAMNSHLFTLVSVSPSKFSYN